jgi:putative phage-type endonuclease
MKIIKEVDQGSQEWLNLRLGKATASNFSNIITSQGKRSTKLRDYALQLASELLLTDYEEAYKSPSMIRGNELEPEAREAYKQFTFNKVEEISFFDCDNYGYSPDGLVNDDGLLEIKCPGAVNHMKYLYENKLPTAYKAQCQGGLMVSNRKYLDFVSYNPLFREGKELFIKRVERDEEFIELLKIYLNEVISLRDKFVSTVIAK